ncbi:MAG TPA: hypothetical protein PKZ75_14385 [Bacteroidia bacterium]|nr:hypothetical protein [Bacteroidia bacterium]
MKLLNIFKKETKKVVKSNVQKLEIKQLEKLVGGATETNPPPKGDYIPQHNW